MRVFEIVIAFLLAGALLSRVAERVRTPYPALMAFVGALLALLPGTPEVRLDPELALTLFVAPVLLNSAFDASQRDLRRNWRLVTGLSLGAVGFTVAVVALLARWLMPDMSWPAAVVLGAIVAPPDAAAATAILQQLRPPYRLLVILEGESMFNDASALLIYRLALGAAATGFLFSWNTILTILAVTGGSVVLGAAVSRWIPLIGIAEADIAPSVILQFSSTFALWLLADRLHLSPVLTVVVYAMLISRRAGQRIPARLRVPSYAVWEVAVFVLNVLAFILVGLQLKPILRGLNGTTLFQYAGFAAVICCAIVAARMLWVLASTHIGQWWCRTHPAQAQQENGPLALEWKSALLVGWCGMRGLVTLATALALPVAASGSSGFPHRDVILFTAFAVVLATLVLQGATVRPLLLRLRLKDDGSIEKEVRLARMATLGAALESIRNSEPSETVELIRRRYDLRYRKAQAIYSHTASADHERTNEDYLYWQRSSDGDGRALATALAAERSRLVELRDDGTIGDVAYQRVEQELDWRELDFEQSVLGQFEEGDHL